MNSELTIHLDKEVDMIRHDFHLDHLSLPFTGDFAKDSFQVIIDSINQNPPTVLRAPHDMILAGVHYTAVRLESPSHSWIMPHGDIEPRSLPAAYPQG